MSDFLMLNTSGKVGQAGHFLPERSVLEERRRFGCSQRSDGCGADSMYTACVQHVPYQTSPIILRL